MIAWQQSAQRGVWVAGGPGGALLTVTRTGRTAWVPAVSGPDGRPRWRGETCRTRLAAQASAEGQVAL